MTTPFKNPETAVLHAGYRSDPATGACEWTLDDVAVWTSARGRTYGERRLLAMGFFGVFLYNLCLFNGLRTVPAGRASLTASGDECPPSR